MNSFKNGAGNLDFGADDNDEKKNEKEEEEESSPETTPSEGQSDSAASNTEEQSSPQSSGSTSTADAGAKYPYFVRRNNVGDERDNRLEIHVRNKVTEREAAFRSELAEQLGVDEVPKTDAREFALLDAYQHPERVAERMQADGFGELD